MLPLNCLTLPSWHSSGPYWRRLPTLREQTAHQISLSPNSFLFWLRNVYFLFIYLPFLWLWQQSLLAQTTQLPNLFWVCNITNSHSPQKVGLEFQWKFLHCLVPSQFTVAPSTQGCPLRNTLFSGTPPLRDTGSPNVGLSASSSESLLWSIFCWVL